LCIEGGGEKLLNATHASANFAAAAAADCAAVKEERRNKK